MELQTSRFGKIVFDKENIFCFKEGLLGLEDLHKFILLPVENNISFQWLQSVEDGSFDLLLADPFIFFADYHVDLSEKFLKEMSIESEKDVLINTVVSIVNDDIKIATTNLLGPLVFNLKNKEGKQIILDGKNYNTKHLLFSQQNKKIVNG